MKKSLILLIVLAALIGFAVLYEKGPLSGRVNSASRGGAPMRTLLLPELSSEEAHIAERVRGIHIQQGDKQVTLTLADGRWLVAERSGYPASFDKVQRAVKLMAEIRIKGKQEIGKDLLDELKLLPPERDTPADQAGLLVELLDEKGAKLASFIAGESTKSSGGASANSGNMFGGPGELRFVRVPAGKDQDTVWSVEDSFYELSSDPKEWVDKAFIDVRKVKSADITAAAPADSWKAERKDENSPFTFVNAAGGEELDTAKVDGLNNLLSGTLFTDVLPKDKVNAEFMKNAVKAKLITLDGFAYEVSALDQKSSPTDASGKAYITVKVSADIPKERKAPADEKPEDKKMNDEAFAANKKMLEDKLAKEKPVEGWVYEVPDYSINVLFKKRSEVLREKEPAAPAPAATPGPGGALSPLAPRPAPGAPRGTITPPPATPGTLPAVQPPPAPPAGPAAPRSPNPETPTPKTKPTEAPSPPPAEARPLGEKKSANDAKPPTEAKPATDTKPSEVKSPADAKPPGQ